jgi:Fe-S cluster biogenesis protein NfuA
MTLKEKIEDALKEVRPMLEADGGNIELVSVTEEGKVTVRLTGACGHCPMSQMTLKMGVERMLKKRVPEIKEVLSA